MNHPLTDKIIEEELITRDECDRRLGDGRANYYEEDFRTAADWQLDQVQKNLEDFLEEFSYRGHGAEAILELRDLVNNFKSYMRPQQENNS